MVGTKNLFVPNLFFFLSVLHVCCDLCCSSPPSKVDTMRPHIATLLRDFSFHVLKYIYILRHPRINIKKSNKYTTHESYGKTIFRNDRRTRRSGARQRRFILSLSRAHATTQADGRPHAAGAKFFFSLCG